MYQLTLIFCQHIFRLSLLELTLNSPAVCRKDSGEKNKTTTKKNEENLMSVAANCQLLVCG